MCHKIKTSTLKDISWKQSVFAEEDNWLLRAKLELWLGMAQFWDLAKHLLFFF